jgi:GcrA cell cycle regulator
MAPKDVWTVESETTLRQMWAAGASGNEIARALKISRSAVLGKRWRLNLPPVEGKPNHSARSRAPSNGVRLPRRVARKRAPVSLPKQIVAKPKQNVGMRSLPLFELKEHYCRWPLGEQLPFMFCAADAENGCPYCSLHAAMAHLGGKKFARDRHIICAT